ncbi:hypothetical protein CC86DRAFT_420551 [Ophiobolus disseminans]|uniref:Uncharacterized protein n=1 Tax=Ophiobolus disseminans TaxID=1469910 RepID=A0A6A6ZST9_9PLEO|nr:hypothetical protein CC86DRAFT_420551 [Ophiobolus disseminans]
MVAVAHSVKQVASHRPPPPFETDLEKGLHQEHHRHKMCEFQLRHDAMTNQLISEHDAAFSQLRDEHNVVIRDLQDAATHHWTQLRWAQEGYMEMRQKYDADVKELKEEIVELRQRNDDHWPY